MTDDTGQPRRRGPLPRLAAGLTGLLRAHLGLVGLELEEAREQFIAALVLALLGVGALLLLLLTATLALVLLVPASDRVLVVASLCALYAVLAAACLGIAWHKLARGPRIFEATLEELRRDQERLGP